MTTLRSLKELRRYLEGKSPRFILEEIPPNGFDIYLPKAELEVCCDDLRRNLPALVSVKLYELSWWRCRFKKQQVLTDHDVY